MSTVKESDRLLYEPLTVAHAIELTDALTDPRVYVHIAGPSPLTTEDLAAEFSRRAVGPAASGQVWWNFAVRLHGGPFIGRIEATAHDGLVEVGYLLGPSYWGHGYATEAMRWLHGRVRQSGFVGTFWATSTPGNFRSIRMLERLGYTEFFSDWPRLLSYDPGDRVFQREPST
jgi:RimJ/RimL family protein N-acetyltransferase